MKRKTVLTITAFAVLSLGGCTYKQPDGTYKEGPLFAHWTKKYYPSVHAQALKDKEVLEYAKRCFTAAKDVADANNCNKGVLTRNPNFEDIEDFDEWDLEEKEEVLEVIEQNQRYIDCMIAAKNITEMADKCKEPRENITTTYLP